jgi:hypothetical protein
MAAKFTAGDSIRQTNLITAKDPPRNAVRGEGRGKSGGMPGSIKTGLGAHEGGAQGGKHMPMPKANSGLSAKTRQIGSRGGSGARELNHPGKKATGTMMSGGKMESLKGRAKTSSERSGVRKSSMMY